MNNKQVAQFAIIAGAVLLFKDFINDNLFLSLIVAIVAGYIILKK